MSLIGGTGEEAADVPSRRGGQPLGEWRFGASYTNPEGEPFSGLLDLWPQRFNNKTNGITPRRWLKLCNPALSALITEHIGEGWIADLEQLAGLVPLAENAEFRRAWRAVKLHNKQELSQTIRRLTGIETDPATLFDCQVKRIHEYKRQLLNAAACSGSLPAADQGRHRHRRSPHRDLRRKSRAGLCDGQTRHSAHSRSGGHGEQ